MLRFKTSKQTPKNLNLDQSGYILFDFVLFLIACVVIFAVFTVFQKVVVHKPSAIAEIKSGVAGNCLDDYHDNLGSNNAVEAWACNGTPAQAWTVSDNLIKHADNYCLSIQNNGSSPNDKIVLNRCSGSASQVWQSAVDGFENPASALCLSLPDGQTGEQLVVASCNNLTKSAEAWQPSTWSQTNTTAASTTCSGSEGELVACNAAKQWVIWQSGSSKHATLLSNYSDGNGYEEWCADFVSYVYQAAGFPFTNGERDGWDEYLAPNVQNQSFTYHSVEGYTPQAGDVAYFDYTGGHVEIVAVGGSKPIFIYGDSGVTDPTTGNGQMTENTLTSKAGEGQLQYYLSPN
ncbi:MAG TPA: ricin-type beta-trefoil lectin domain protein [Candidatus Binatia bacterium]|nr:ricin-type beta-trefoil lectin domain protein [Candidatus Binatia bacterium]